MRNFDRYINAGDLNGNWMIHWLYTSDCYVARYIYVDYTICETAHVNLAIRKVVNNGSRQIISQLLTINYCYLAMTITQQNYCIFLNFY